MNFMSVLHPALFFIVFLYRCPGHNEAVYAECANARELQDGSLARVGATATTATLAIGRTYFRLIDRSE